MTTTPAHGIMVSIYLSNIYTAFVACWFLRSMYALKYSVYFGILTCSRVWFTTALEGWLELLVSAVKIINWRQVSESCADTWHKWIQLLRQGSCSCPVGNLPTRLWESKTTDELTVLWRSYWQRHNTELTTVLGNHWHCCICSYCHNIISSGSPPVFLECTSYASVRMRRRHTVVGLCICVCICVSVCL